MLTTTSTRGSARAADNEGQQQQHQHQQPQQRQQQHQQLDQSDENAAPLALRDELCSPGSSSSSDSCSSSGSPAPATPPECRTDPGYNALWVGLNEVIAEEKEKKRARVRRGEAVQEQASLTAAAATSSSSSRSSNSSSSSSSSSSSNSSSSSSNPGSTTPALPPCGQGDAHDALDARPVVTFDKEENKRLLEKERGLHDPDQQQKDRHLQQDHHQQQQQHQQQKVEQQQEEEKVEEEQNEQEQEEEEVEEEQEGGGGASVTAGDTSSTAPEKTVLADRASRDALEAAMAATERATHDIRDAFSQSSTVVMRSQDNTVKAWKQAASALHTVATQLTADNAQLTADNETLRSEKRVLEAKVGELVAERDRLVLTLQEVIVGSAHRTSDNGSGYGNPDAGGMGTFPPTMLSATGLCTRASSIAADVAAAAAITFDCLGTGSSRGLMSAATTPPSIGELPSVSEQQGQTEPMTTTMPSPSPCALSVFASVAATAEPLPMAEDMTMTTTDNPQAADLSAPSALDVLSSLAADAKPLPLETMDTTATSAPAAVITAAATPTPTPTPVRGADMEFSTPFALAALASFAANAEPLSLEVTPMHTISAPPATTAPSPTPPPAPAATTAASSTPPSAPTATTTATPTPPPPPAAPTTAAPTPPPAPSTIITAAPPATPTPPTAPAATSSAAPTPPPVPIATTTAAPTATTPKRTSVYANENEAPQQGRGVKVSAGKTGGRPRWVGVGGGSAVLSTPGVSSVQKRASISSFSPSVARTPLGTVPTNSTPLSVLADRPRANKTVACVGTSGLDTEAGFSQRGSSGSVCGGGGGGGGGWGGVSRAPVTRRNDGGGVSSVAGGAKETKRASATRATLSSMAAARPTAIGAKKRAVAQQRPSTRSQLADHEKTDGMARRLRSSTISRSTQEAAPAVSAGRKNNVLTTGAGVASRTRQATLAAAARGGGKVVRKRWV